MQVLSGGCDGGRSEQGLESVGGETCMMLVLREVRVGMQGFRRGMERKQADKLENLMEERS